MRKLDRPLTGVVDVIWSVSRSCELSTYRDLSRYNVGLRQLQIRDLTRIKGRVFAGSVAVTATTLVDVNATGSLRLRKSSGVASRFGMTVGHARKVPACHHFFLPVDVVSGTARGPTRILESAWPPIQIACWLLASSRRGAANNMCTQIGAGPGRTRVRKCIVGRVSPYTLNRRLCASRLGGCLPALGYVYDQHCVFRIRMRLGSMRGSRIGPRSGRDNLI